MTDPNMRGTPAHPGNTATSTPESASSSSTKPTSAGTITSAGAGASESANTNSNKPSQPSLASRIQSSATGLARSALTGPNDYAQTLNNATQGKATSSGSGLGSSSSAGQTLPSNQTTTHHPSTSSTATNNDIPQAQTIRSHEPKAGGAFTIPNLTEEEFQRAYTDDGIYGRAYYQDQINATSSSGSSTHSSTDLQSSTGNWKGKHRLQDPVQLEYTTAWERATPHTQTPVQPKIQHQDIATDGADVVSLLSDPTFDPVYDPNPDMENELETDLETPAPLSKEEIDILESFRRDFARSEENHYTGVSAGTSVGIGQIPQGPVPISSASLIPSIDELFPSPTDTALSGSANFNSNSNSNSTILRDKVLSELPGSNEWIEVQERYHDEVWGYLRPALEAARAEIEEKQNENGNEGGGVGHSDGDGPAVRRLRMILKHMGG